MRKALRATATVLGGAAWLLLAPLTAGTAHARPDPPPGTDFGRLFGGLGELLAHLPAGISDALRDMLRELLPEIWGAVMPDFPGVLARGFLLVLGYLAHWWMAGLDPILAGEALRNSLLVQTPDSWVRGSAEVTGMARDVRDVAAALAAALVPIAFLGVYLGLTDVREALTSSLGGLVGVFAWEHVAGWLLDFGNVLCLALLGNVSGFPGWGGMADAGTAAVATGAQQAALATGAAVLVFVVAGVVTFVGAIFHLCWVVVLYVLGPLAFAISVIPAFNSIGKATGLAFGIAAVCKAPGVVALKLASALLGAAAFGGEGPEGVMAAMVAVGVAWAYTGFLRRGAGFAGGHLLASGRQVTRTIRLAASPTSAVRQQLAQRVAGGVPGVGGGAERLGTGAPAFNPQAHAPAHTLGQPRGRAAGHLRGQ